MNTFPRSAGEVLQLTPEMDLLCFSHLRWRFVTQRPQHLLRRAAGNRRVFYWEEPFRHTGSTMPLQANVMSWDSTDTDLDGIPRFLLEIIQEGDVTVLRPHLRADMTEKQSAEAQTCLLSRFLRHARITNYLTWYYTPMATAFTHALRPAVTVYDCMDELSLFHGAPPALRIREEALLRMADVVFTGGISLYEAKRKRHGNVHAFPSSIDHAHFASAKAISAASAEPDDQAGIPHPRAGFYGVLDERLDTGLLRELARLLPHVHFVLIGPVVKIDPAMLPAGPNLHYLGAKQYEDLPSYLAGWDVALLPFSLNEATRFISPTKTPEYLAAGKPVVSTPICDVVREYGDEGLVRIAETPEASAAAVEASLQPQPDTWREAVRRKLAQTSWDRTWSQMESEIAFTLARKKTARNHFTLRPSTAPIANLIAGATSIGKTLTERTLE